MFGGQGKINGRGGMLKLPSDNTFPENTGNRTKSFGFLIKKMPTSITVQDIFNLCKRNRQNIFLLIVFSPATSYCNSAKQKITLEVNFGSVLIT